MTYLAARCLWPCQARLTRVTQHFVWVRKSFRALPPSPIKSTAGTRQHFPVDLSCLINGDLPHSSSRRGDIFRKGKQFPFCLIEPNTVVNFPKVPRSFCSPSPSLGTSPKEPKTEKLQLCRQIPADPVLQQRGYIQSIDTDSDETHLNAQSSEQLLLSSLQHATSEREREKKNKSSTIFGKMNNTSRYQHFISCRTCPSPIRARKGNWE